MKTEEYHDFRGYGGDYRSNIKVGDWLEVLQYALASQRSDPYSTFRQQFVSEASVLGLNHYQLEMISV
jgi:hypothetical protein